MIVVCYRYRIAPVAVSAGILHIRITHRCSTVRRVGCNVVNVIVVQKTVIVIITSSCTDFTSVNNAITVGIPPFDVVRLTVVITVSINVVRLVNSIAVHRLDSIVRCTTEG